MYSVTYVTNCRPFDEISFSCTDGKFAKFVILLPEDGESKRKKRRPGSAKGILQVLEEDNAHLDDFKEYMP